MNIVKPSRVAVALAAAFAFAGITACHHEHAAKVAAAPSGGVSSGHLIGTTPAQPTGDPPGTTPVAGSTTEVTKQAETTQKPSEGDVHAYSSLAKENPQKAGGYDGQQQGERSASKAAISPETAAVGNDAEKKEQKYEVK